MQTRFKLIHLILWTIALFTGLCCTSLPASAQGIRTGAERIDEWLPRLEGKTVKLVVNHSSLVGDRHLVDVLLDKEVDVRGIFAPEHGFRGKADAGATVKDGKDSRTGLPIHSLYGKNKRPSAELLEGVDYVIFDIQDVGVRFYTYLSTMHCVMDACAEFGPEVWILDRPNPNIAIVDGPVLESEHSSFIGMHPIPVLHGMTLGELARMIKGEGWISNAEQLKMRVVPIDGYDRSMPYSIQVAPSPNLPDDHAIALYPSTCFFEGTVFSEGRGTDYPFRYIGHPVLEDRYVFSFTPEPNAGSSKPKLQGRECFGLDLSVEDPPGRLRLDWLIELYDASGMKDEFFRSDGFFELLAGTKVLRKMIQQGAREDEIRESWQQDLEAFRLKRAAYLLYPESTDDE